MSKKLEDLNPRENIIIKGAKMHNLKNVDVVIPHNKLVVVTGVSVVVTTGWLQQH